MSKTPVAAPPQQAQAPAAAKPIAAQQSSSSIEAQERPFHDRRDPWASQRTSGSGRPFSRRPFASPTAAWRRERPPAAPPSKPFPFQLMPSFSDVGIEQRTASRLPTMAIQCQREAADPPPANMHRVAASGFTGSAQSLPHLQRIQRAFGPHDLSGVKAYVGGPAAQASREISARAYTVGEHVAFAESPDLHTAAHEAAHVVQQRRGVSLPMGIGRANDRYEQHADQVADRVIISQNAADLLDPVFFTQAQSAAQSIQNSQGDEQDDRDVQMPLGNNRQVQRMGGDNNSSNERARQSEAGRELATGLTSGLMGTPHARPDLALKTPYQLQRYIVRDDAFNGAVVRPGSGIGDDNKVALFKAKTKVDLNVRRGPGVGHNKAGDALPEGTEVEVFEERNGWYRIGEGRWVSGSSKYIERLQQTNRGNVQGVVKRVGGPNENGGPSKRVYKQTPGNISQGKYLVNQDYQFVQRNGKYYVRKSPQMTKDKNSLRSKGKNPNTINNSSKKTKTEIKAEKKIEASTAFSKRSAEILDGDYGAVKGSATVLEAGAEASASASLGEEGVEVKAGGNVKLTLIGGKLRYETPSLDFSFMGETMSLLVAAEVSAEAAAILGGDIAVQVNKRNGGATIGGGITGDAFAGAKGGVFIIGMANWKSKKGDLPLIGITTGVEGWAGIGGKASFTAKLSPSIRYEGYLGVAVGLGAASKVIVEVHPINAARLTYILTIKGFNVDWGMIKGYATDAIYDIRELTGNVVNSGKKLTGNVVKSGKKLADTFNEVGGDIVDWAGKLLD